MSEKRPDSLFLNFLGSFEVNKRLRCFTKVDEMLRYNVDLATRQRMWLQEDGAPPHFALIVCEFLNLNFNERWIGRGGPFE